MKLTRRKEVSLNGHKPDVLKSAIQKYCRRGELTKGLWCCIELNLMGSLENSVDLYNTHAKLEQYTPEKIRMSAKCIRSSLMNRLIVIMSEEISISNWWVPIEMKNIYDSWNNKRNSSTNIDNELELCGYILSLYRMLTESPKCRIISDLTTVYNLPPYYFKVESVNDTVYYELIDKHFNSEMKTKFGKMFSTNSRNGIYLEKIAACLINCDESVFFYLSMSLKCARANVGNVWALVLDMGIIYPQLAKVLLALKFFFNIMTHKDYWIYLYNAILIVVNRNIIDFNEFKTCTLYKFEDVNELLKINLSMSKIFTIDDYVYDKHTNKNYKVGDEIKFALEGAFVKDECTKFLNCEYRRLYILNKYLVESALYQKKRKSFKICDIIDDKNVKKIKIDFTKNIESESICENFEIDEDSVTVIYRNICENKKK